MWTQYIEQGHIISVCILDSIKLSINRDGWAICGIIRNYLRKAFCIFYTERRKSTRENKSKRRDHNVKVRFISPNSAKKFTFPMCNAKQRSKAGGDLPIVRNDGPWGTARYDHTIATKKLRPIVKVNNDIFDYFLLKLHQLFCYKFFSVDFGRIRTQI